MNISDDLFYNIVQDLRKKELSTAEKGELVKAYLVEHKVSEREFGRRFDISHSTVHDWVSGRQKEKYYADKESSKDLLLVGFSEKEKYNVDFLLDRLLFVISRKDFVVTSKTRRLISELKSELDKVRV